MPSAWEDFWNVLKEIVAAGRQEESWWRVLTANPRGWVILLIASDRSQGAVDRRETITMARLFNLQVMKATLIGGSSSPLYSDPELNGTLGTADTLFTQIYVDGVGINNTDVTVDLESSNDGVTWKASGFPMVINVPTAGAGPIVDFKVFPNQAAFGRFAVSASKDNAIVRVIACGRSL